MELSSVFLCRDIFVLLFVHRPYYSHSYRMHASHHVSITKKENKSRHSFWDACDCVVKEDWTGVLSV